MKFMFITLLTAALASSQLAARDFQAGVHYQQIGPLASIPDDRVQVIEAFAYPCPACRNFLPHITSWVEDRPDYVDFRRLPIALRQGWEMFVKAYYTAELGGASHDAHEALFRALHDERRQFRTFEDIVDFYADQGFDRDEFLNLSKSVEIEDRMRENLSEVRQLEIRLTPTVIVQGKWKVSPSGFGSYHEMIEVVDYLVEREARALELDGSCHSMDVHGIATELPVC